MAHHNETEHLHLPEKFTQSLRVLFELLDDQKKGTVHLRDILSYWAAGGDTAGLPAGIKEALQKVALPDGWLSFERFLGGIKIALLRHNSNAPNTPSRTLGTSSSTHVPYTQTPESSESANETPKREYDIDRRKTGSSAKVEYDIQRNLPNLSLSPIEPRNDKSYGNLNNSWTPESPSTATIQPFNFVPTARAKSLSDLPGRISPRTGLVQQIVSQFQERRDQMLPENNRSNPKDGFASHHQMKNEGETATKKKPARKREVRRHTVSHGVDYHMIKRLKQLEQEKDILVQGLETVQQTQVWYQQQIRAVEEKQKYLGKDSSSDYSLEAAQERLNFQTARISEVNQQLRILMHSSEKGFPLHMNLHVNQPRPGTSSQADLDKGMMSRLKSQNRMLTQEVSQKSDRISQLEKEKAALIRQMFETKSSGRNNNYDDTMFM